MAFLNFGTWQLRRHAERAERNAVVEARAAAPAVPLETALADAAAARAGRAGGDAAVHPLAYRRVVLEGTFEPEHEVLRRPVARDGVPGYHVVTPLVLDDGRWVLVERGWVPQDVGAPPVADAAPPPGRVTVEGWAFPGERPPEGALAWLAPRDPAEGRLTTVAYVDPERLARQMPVAPDDVVVLADVPARPPADRSLPLPPPAPATDPGPHLGYAIQWFAFALVGIVGYAALLRTVTRGEGRAPTLSPPPSPAPPRAPGP